MRQPWTLLCCTAFGFLWIAAALPAIAQAPGRQSCEDAIRVHAARLGAPPELGLAISKVESGHNPYAIAWLEPGSPKVPEAGRSFFGTNAKDAVAKLRELMRRGIRPDVGCMQVSLKHHPHAFGDLEAAFQPEINVGYALGYLAELKQRHGNWPKAAAFYHNGEFGKQYRYLSRILSALKSEELDRGLPGDSIGAVAAAAENPRQLRARYSAAAIHAGGTAYAEGRKDLAALNKDRNLAIPAAAPISITGWIPFK